MSLEQKRLDQNKPFDAKVAAWIPDKEEGFVQGKIVGTKGDLVTVAIPGGDVSQGKGGGRGMGEGCVGRGYERDRERARERMMMSWVKVLYVCWK